MDNGILGIILSVGFILLITGLVVYSVYTEKKKKESSWEGVVIDKAIKEQVHDTSMNRNNDNEGGISLISLKYTNRPQSSAVVTHTYFMKIKPLIGEEFEWEITSGSYEQINIGDKVAKKSGTTAIDIIEKATPSHSPTTQPQPAPLPAPQVTPPPPAISEAPSVPTESETTLPRT